MIEAATKQISNSMNSYQIPGYQTPPQIQSPRLQVSRDGRLSVLVYQSGTPASVAASLIREFGNGKELLVAGDQHGQLIQPTREADHYAYYFNLDPARLQLDAGDYTIEVLVNDRLHDQIPLHQPNQPVSTSETVRIF